MNHTELIVTEELDNFYEDSAEREQRLRMLLSWSSTIPSCELPSMQIGPPKKKFQPKTSIRTPKKANDRRRNSTF